MKEERKMNNAMNPENKFYVSLKNLFVGENVEGISGYVNLMRIKSSYFNHVFNSLKNEIDSQIPDPDFKTEFYDKLHTFFNRYFSDAGSIYFNRTPFFQNIYEKVYSDKKDVALFWKTHMLYYVKTEKHYTSIMIKVDGYKIYFDVSSLQGKKAWEKRDLIYSLAEQKSTENNADITFNVIYSERGRTTKLDEIMKTLKKRNIQISMQTLQKAFKVFEKQSEIDYFINKDAKRFLKEQFDLWMFQYIFSDLTAFSEIRINQLKFLKDMAYKIIDFISQFENEVMLIWNKPKFVLNSQYVITLDRIAAQETGIKIIENIINHPSFAEQLKEWKELAILPNNSPDILIIVNNDNTPSLNPLYRFLPIDTIHFDDTIKYQILSLFNDLDNQLDGWLIRSENYQALNTILPKFRDKVTTIYIDPPFNKEKDADYFYSVKFKNATWITMLENRIRLARDFLVGHGNMFVRCDYNGNMFVRLLLDDIFGEENFRNEIAVTRTKTALYLATPEKLNKNLGESYDNIYWYSKSESTEYPKISKGIIKIKRESYWKDLKSFYDRPANQYELLGITPQQGCSWVWKKDDSMQAIENYEEFLKIYNKTNYKNQSSQEPKEENQDSEDEEHRSQMLDELLEKYWIETGKKKRFARKMGSTIKYWIEPIRRVSITDWTHLEGYARRWGFPTENSENLLKIIIDFSSDEAEIVMDFFSGSGATVATAHKMKRKWIGIEMGEHFNSVILPRMKKVSAYDPTGISKDSDIKEKYNKNQAGAFFKYYELEQFEQTLKRTKYQNCDPLNAKRDEIYSQYVFLKDLKLTEALNIDENSGKVRVKLESIYSNIDAAETLSCVLGKRIKKCAAHFVEFEDGTRIDYDSIDYNLIKPLIWWSQADL